MEHRTLIDELLVAAVPTAPALSPDGTRAVYALRTCDLERDAVAHGLWLLDTAGGPAGRLTAGTSDTEPAWSPDGTLIAFVRETDGAPQVWLTSADGDQPRQLTRLLLGAGAPVWSPDGHRIAFTAWVDTAAAPDEDDAARSRRANAPCVTDRTDYQPDGVGLLRGRRRHVHLLEVADGACRTVTSGDGHAGTPAWSPDGRRLAFAARTADDRDLRGRAPVHVVDVDDPAAVARPVALLDGVAGAVTWADRDSLVVVGTRGDPVGHDSLLRVRLDGGPPVDLAAALDRNVMPGGPGYPGGAPRLADDGRTVLFCVRDRGCTHLYRVGLDGGDLQPVLAGAGRVVSGFAVSGHTVAVVLAEPDSFGEVVVLDLVTGSETARSDHGADLAHVPMAVPEQRTFTISDGTVVEGWLLRDPSRAGPLPLLLDVHGGPHNAWNAAADPVHLYHRELVARGWAVLLVNPRGSDGYGEQFYRGVFGGWGTADALDLLEPVDALVTEGVADPGRLALTGYSYGGFMTCYLTGIDGRFAAAVAGGVVSDLTSMTGTCEDGLLMARYELGAEPWHDRERYAAMSPYERVERVRTPTLVLHGAADTTCPLGQAQQWHAALRAQGVPTRLVMYPGGSHLFILDGPPSHRADYSRRLVDWVEQHTGTAGHAAVVT